MLGSSDHRLRLTHTQRTAAVWLLSIPPSFARQNPQFLLEEAAWHTPDPRESPCPVSASDPGLSVSVVHASGHCTRAWVSSLCSLKVSLKILLRTPGQGVPFFRLQVTGCSRRPSCGHEEDPKKGASLEKAEKKDRDGGESSSGGLWVPCVSAQEVRALNFPVT